MAERCRMRVHESQSRSNVWVMHIELSKGEDVCLPDRRKGVETRQVAQLADFRGKTVGLADMLSGASPAQVVWHDVVVLGTPLQSDAPSARPPANANQPSHEKSEQANHRKRDHDEQD